MEGLALGFIAFIDGAQHWDNISAEDNPAVIVRFFNEGMRDILKILSFLFLFILIKITLP